MFPLLAIAVAGVLALTLSSGPTEDDSYDGLLDGDAEVFAGVLPSRARPYAAVILRVADELGLSPSLLYALGDRETLWGTASSLDRPGPGGTGDFGRRNAARWGFELPPDGRGWGRGLMQIDFGSNKAWLDSNNWADPYSNIRKGGELYIAKREYLSARGLDGDDLVVASIAAYNAGEGHVWSLIDEADEGVSVAAAANSATTGGNYANDVLDRRDRVTTAYADAGGQAEV